MSPRTRIREEQTDDLSFVTELEFRDFFLTFFDATVVTGTVDDELGIPAQTFSEYLPGRGILTAGPGITVATGVGFIQVSAPGSAAPLPLVGDPFISVVTGTNVVNLYTDAIVGGTGITVVSGVNTVTISSTAAGSTPNAIVSGSPDLTVTSGSNVVIISDNNRAVLAQSQGTSSLLAVSSGTNTINLTAKAIVPDATGFLSVTSGTSTVTLTADAIVGVSGNSTVISGSSAVTVSGVVTVTSGIAYINDATRGGKSLSVSRPVLDFGFNGLADGNYLHIATSEHTNVGFPIWRPATITAISAYFPSGPNNKVFEVRKNGTGTSIRTLLVSPTVMSINDAENIDLNKGDYLQVFVSSALTGAQDPVVSIEIAWRLP